MTDESIENTGSSVPEDEYETKVMKFLDNELAATEKDQNEKNQLDELDIVVADLLKQAIRESNQQTERLKVDRQESNLVTLPSISEQEAKTNTETTTPTRSKNHRSDPAREDGTPRDNEDDNLKSEDGSSETVTSLSSGSPTLLTSDQRDEGQDDGVHHLFTSSVVPMRRKIQKAAAIAILAVAIGALAYHFSNFQSDASTAHDVGQANEDQAAVEDIDPALLSAPLLDENISEAAQLQNSQPENPERNALAASASVPSTGKAPNSSQPRSKEPAVSVNNRPVEKPKVSEAVNSTAEHSENTDARRVNTDIPDPKVDTAALESPAPQPEEAELPEEVGNARLDENENTPAFSTVDKETLYAQADYSVSPVSGSPINTVDTPVAVSQPADDPIGSIANPVQPIADSPLNRESEERVANPPASSNPPPANPIPAVLLSKVTPSYPLQARRSELTGTVVLDIDINEEGRVVEATPLSGPKVFYSEAVKAVLNWRYRPASLHGINIPSKGRVTLNFSID